MGATSGSGTPRRLDTDREIRQHRGLEEITQRHLDAEDAAQTRQHLSRKQGRPVRPRMQSAGSSRGLSSSVKTLAPEWRF